jgi:Flp pilus assembly protein TadD
VATARTYVKLRGEGFLDAEATAREALDANPKSAANHNNLGICLLYDGKPFAAREAFEAALAIDPQLPGALYNLAIVETVYDFDPDAGRRWFDRYLEVASDDPDDLKSLLAAIAALADTGGDR